MVYILSRNVFELSNVHVASPPFFEYDEHLTHAIKKRNLDSKPVLDLSITASQSPCAFLCFKCFLLIPQGKKRRN